MKRITTAAILACIAAGASADDDTILIDIDRPVLEPGEFARVVFAPALDTARDFAMAGWTANIRGDAFAGGLSDISAIAPWISETGGVPCNGGWCGLIVGQLNFPAAGIFADPSSPLPAYGMAFTAPPVTEPTEIAFETETIRFMVYPERMSSESQSRLDELVEGRATILVVPCRADFNNDGSLDIFDFLDFQNAFALGDPMADFDFDGELTIFDFLAFQTRFDRGC